MLRRNWKNHRVVLGLIVLACGLADVTVIAALVSVASWLLGAVSPLTWGALCVVVIMTARLARLIRWVVSARQLATGTAFSFAEADLPDAAAVKSSRRSLQQPCPESGQALSRSAC